MEIERNTRAATSPRLSGHTPAQTQNEVLKYLTSGTKISEISEDVGASTFRRVCPTKLKAAYTCSLRLQAANTRTLRSHTLEAQGSRPHILEASTFRRVCPTKVCGLFGILAAECQLVAAW